ncbi:uncharacterized protein (DUF1778 family) [Rhodothalassium salexigens DSM 2132]|uniref:Uncharacterized protein (DUF1778 family) n=1 Tax=Rhodothalassium salexigens DSM 2132 TaxID=1188247 RepID=A0A4R2PFE0_RHOSA|nr:DUF1778 domain-containing protein [Rhodothalassium salexigens]MBB4211693.1 uncharacterized protein (DUF1778 family) [Rhodothalassium salexigens DSM 2132]MBK1638976.1 hypothetical protein [Rhodothalassium salexigens DSM 2132]TCP34009.1 uncharacterized protein (DUF1778 family) [Rhodothalassium salexigens DSM 2132]
MPSTFGDAPPPAPAKRSERLEARITEEQKQLFARAAALTGSSVSEFVVRSVQAAAQQTLHDHQTMTLGARDASAFVTALLSDAEPNEALRAAARRYRTARADGE